VGENIEVKEYRNYTV